MFDQFSLLCKHGKLNSSVGLTLDKALAVRASIHIDIMQSPAQYRHYAITRSIKPLINTTSISVMPMSLSGKFSSHPFIPPHTFSAPAAPAPPP